MGKHLIGIGSIVLLLGMIIACLVGCQTWDYVYDQLPDIWPAETNTPEVVTNVVASPDEIELDQITWLDRDASGWSITQQLRVEDSGSILIFRDYDGTVWPKFQLNGSGKWLNGNVVVFIAKDNRWHAAACDWMEYGTSAKTKRAFRGGDGHIPHPPFDEWKPVPGEVIGICITAPSRGAVSTVQERSPIRLWTWK